MSESSDDKQIRAGMLMALIEQPYIPGSVKKRAMHELMRLVGLTLSIEEAEFIEVASKTLAYPLERKVWARIKAKKAATKRR